MSVISLRLPDDLRMAASAQAERVGVSLDEYLLSIVAFRVGGQEEVERYLRDRSRRMSRERALEILRRVGGNNPPEPGDEIPPDLIDRWGPDGTAWKE